MMMRLIVEAGVAISCILTTTEGDKISGYLARNKYEIQRWSGDIVIQQVVTCHTGNTVHLATIEIEQLDEEQKERVELLRN